MHIIACFLLNIFLTVSTCVLACLLSVLVMGGSIRTYWFAAPKGWTCLWFVAPTGYSGRPKLITPTGRLWFRLWSSAPVASTDWNYFRKVCTLQRVGSWNELYDPDPVTPSTRQNTLPLPNDAVIFLYPAFFFSFHPPPKNIIDQLCACCTGICLVWLRWRHRLVLRIFRRVLGVLEVRSSMI